LIRLRVKDAKSRCNGKEFRTKVMLGMLFIVLGGLELAYQGFAYKHQKKVLDVGPITQQQKNMTECQFHQSSYCGCERRRFLGSNDDQDDSSHQRKSAGCPA
jgi:hypothetical protein